MAFNTVIPEDPWTQAFNLGQYRQGVLQQYPAGQVIQQRLTGRLPADVLANIYQQGAERGVSTGMPGGPNANAATMRALGLTSYGIQSEGLKDLAEMYRLPGAPPPAQNRLWTPGLQNTNYPIGGGAAGGAGGGGGPGAGTTRATEPVAPGAGGYDSWVSDWMRRTGVGGAGGAPLATYSPAGGGVPGLAGGGTTTTTGLPIEPGEELGLPYNQPPGAGSPTPDQTLTYPDRSVYDPTGAGLAFGDLANYGDPNWWRQYVEPSPSPADTTTFEDQSIYDPTGAGLYYYGG